MAFKLDIDTESIEQALMKQVAEDDALFGMISEMFFEQHHNGTEVSDPITGVNPPCYPQKWS